MNWLPLALWGGVVGLDGTSAVQSMISRPLAAATLMGAILGHPAEGLAVGIILEIFELATLPIGAARYPESGLGSVVAVYLYLEMGGRGLDAAALLPAVAFGLVWGWAAGSTVILQRHLNGRLISMDRGWRVSGARRVERLHLTAIALDWSRAVGMSIIGVWLGTWIFGRLGHQWRLDPGSSTGIMAIAVVAMLGAALPIFGDWGSQRRIFTVGVICGLMLLLIR